MNTDISQQRKLDSEMKDHKDSISNLKERTKEMFVAVDTSVQMLAGQFQGVEVLLKAKDDEEKQLMRKEIEELKAVNQKLVIDNAVLSARLDDCESQIVVRDRELKKKDDELKLANARNFHLSTELQNLNVNHTSALQSVNLNMDKKMKAIQGVLRNLVSAAGVPLQKGGEVPKQPINNTICRTPLFLNPWLQQHLLL